MLQVMSSTMPQLRSLLESFPLQPSSQLSRFLFQHLTSLTVTSIHSRDLAALDCPQLQTLTVRQLQVDSAASLRACGSGILHNCSSIYKLFTYNHGKEFKEAAAGDDVLQLGPPPSASMLLEALAPWQPRFCRLLPGALSSVATRLTQLTCLDLRTSPVAVAHQQQQATEPSATSQELSSTCLVQLLWAFASHEHCQAALLRAAAPVLYELRYWARLAWALSTLGLASEEAYHQRLARLMQERQQQLQRPTPAAGAVAAAQRPSRLQQRGRGHTAAPAARFGAGQGPRGGLECADEQDWMGRSRAQSQLLL
ncbi:hypothetical protein HaLaN_10474 [Haematococcus lacustris]|uniref:Uncharacterized protein n=1 Tax=Haematococcus lacustris TaxID=44745 RepID=A0A699YW46_HAELA|nr:hypothetical protein HaLaN_10474 [Haematococcus lacustris]